jgi:hypothetical protein
MPEKKSVPVGYFVAPDAFGDVHVWRERGECPVPVVAYHGFRDDPELWDYLVSALPHLAPEASL